VKDKRKPGRKLSASQKKRNRKQGSVRAKVEHVFRVIKCQFGYRKVRDRGRAKNEAQLFTLTALANIFLARKRLGGSLSKIGKWSRKVDCSSNKYS
jgi:IS5 family transposase